MSNIINPFNKETPKPAVFDLKLAGEVAGALGRFRELSALDVQTPAHAAEIQGTIQYLSQTFLTHGETLLGSWFTVRQEYQPLLQAFATVAHRVGGILNRNAQTAAAPAEGETAENAKQ